MSEWPSTACPAGMVPIYVRRLDDLQGAFFRRAGRPLGGLLLLTHLADETDTLARQRPDQPLFGPAVADGTADRADPRVQRRFGNDPFAPDRLDQFIPADDALAVADQIFEQIEDLRFDGDGGCTAAKLAPVQVQDEIVKKIKQINTPNTSKGLRRDCIQSDTSLKIERFVSRK